MGSGKGKQASGSLWQALASALSKAGSYLNQSRKRIPGALQALAALVTIVAFFLTLFSPDGDEPDPTPSTPVDPSLPPRPQLPSSCDKIVALDGSDTNSGTADAPLETVDRLATSLAPGQTGCLREGAYVFDEIILDTPRIRLTSYPEERATLRGRIMVNGSGVTLERLVLDSHNLEALEGLRIMAPAVAINDNEITSHHSGICIRLGVQDGESPPDRVIIEGNRIHDCGKLPSGNNGFGVEVRNGTGTVIRNNVIYENADSAINLYPDAQRVRIANNTIDGNGVGISFAGDGTTASSNNIVENNIIANSAIRWNIEDWWGPEGDGPLVGVGNVVRSNCLLGTNQDSFYNARGGIAEGGYTATDNLIADPRYLDRAGKNFRLAERSPCTGKGAA